MHLYLPYDIKKIVNYTKKIKVGSRVEHFLWLNYVNQLEANVMASDWIKYRFHSLVTDNARL